MLTTTPAKSDALSTSVYETPMAASPALRRIVNADEGETASRASSTTSADITVIEKPTSQSLPKAEEDEAPKKIESLAQRMRRQETPKRRSLREAVAKTVGKSKAENTCMAFIKIVIGLFAENALNNSPKVELEPRKKPNTPLLAVKNDGKITKASTSSPSSTSNSTTSPGIAKWKKVIKRVMTPDVLRKARLLQQQEQRPKKSVEMIGQRLANASTKASQAKKPSSTNTSPTSSRTSSSSSTSASTVVEMPWINRVTKPAPFKFATKKPLQPQHQPIKATTGQVDFTKMLRTYKTENATSNATSTSTGITVPVPFSFEQRQQRRSLKNPSPANRRRSRSVDGRSRIHGRSASSAGSFSGNNDAPKTKVARAISPFSFVDRDLAKVKEKVAKTPKEDKFDFHRSLRSYDDQETMEHKPLEVTRVNPFSFENRAKRRRSRSVGSIARELEQEAQSKPRIIKAKPAPHFGVPNILKEERPTTRPEPFSFEQRDIYLREQKQRKIEQIHEDDKKAREFKANPVPEVLHKPVQLPMKEVVLPTKPQPFQLEIDKRVEPRIQKWQESVEEDLKRQREAAALFKAKEAKILEQKPFVPAKSEKPLSEVSNFELNSERRARDREQFEMSKRNREAEMESYKMQLADRKRQEEEEDIRRMRREAVHKAQPVKHYKPVHILPSDKPLTEPQSPHFSQLKSTLRKDNN